jgi:hypothetical protein
MPTIRQYQTQESAQAGIPGRAASGTDLFVPTQTGDSLIVAANRMQEEATKDEVTDVQVRMAQLRAKATVDLATAKQSATPGDPTWADPIQNSLQEQIAKIGEGIRSDAATRSFKMQSATLTGDMVEKTGVYHAQLKGQFAVQQYATMQKSWETTLTSDPSQFDRIAADAENQLRDPNGQFRYIDAPDREKLARGLRGDLAKAAARGMISADPEYALDQLKKDRYGDLGTDLKKQLTGEANTAITAARLEQERVKKANEDALKKQREKIEGDIIKQWVADPNSVSPKAIAGSGLDNDDKIKWLNRIESAGKAPMKLNADLYTELFQRIHAPFDNPLRISDPSQLDQYLGKGITPDALQQLRGEVVGKRTPEGSTEAELKKRMFDTAKQTLSGRNEALGIRDPKGAEQTQKFMAWFLPEYERQRKAGKTAVELLDPESEDYLGHGMGLFKRSSTQMFRDMFDANPEAVTAGKLPGAPAGATASARNAKGERIFKVNGNWVDAQGKAVK